jgi:hypothetical protein
VEVEELAEFMLVIQAEGLLVGLQELAAESEEVEARDIIQQAAGALVDILKMEAMVLMQPPIPLVVKAASAAAAVAAALALMKAAAVVGLDYLDQGQVVLVVMGIVAAVSVAVVEVLGVMGAEVSTMLAVQEEHMVEAAAGLTGLEQLVQEAVGQFVLFGPEQQDNFLQQIQVIYRRKKYVILN